MSRRHFGCIRLSGLVACLADSTTLNSLRVIAFAVVLAGGTASAVQAPAITFAHPPDAAPPYGGGLSRENLYPPNTAGTAPTPTPGPLVEITGRTISAVRVTWSDSTRFKDEQQVTDFLRELLTSKHTDNYRWHVWSWGDTQPALTATVEHRNGKTGRWIVWCPRPAVYWAYQDGSGTWWWGSSPLTGCAAPSKSN